MMMCVRTAAPDLLVKHAERITKSYIARRTEQPAYRFNWPKCDGLNLYEVVRDALKQMTQSHCAYCDFAPIDAVAFEEVDHFRPKSVPDFYHLVCNWENLFLICSRCNGEKREKWNDGLLRPDEPGFSFDRFFFYEPETGRIVPNPTASLADQDRSKCTINLLNLNRAGACSARKIVAKEMQSEGFFEEGVVEIAYRFLLPICRNEQKKVD